jgi:periplasmic protein TonB
MPSASAMTPSASTGLNDAGDAVRSPGPETEESNGRSALADVPDPSKPGLAASASGASGPGPQHARQSPATESGEGQATYTEYLGGLRQRIHEALRYPPAARRRGLTGSVTLELTILPSGVIRDVSVVESSSHAVLDEAALDTVRSLRAQPFPRNVPPRTLRVRLPVVFHLQ